MLAVKEGRDDLAKQALIRQKEHTERAQVLRSTWESQAAETEKLKGSLRALNDKIEEAKRKRNLLIAKQKRAQAQRRIHETMSGLSDTSAFEAFNRMADKIEQEERKSVAQAEVTEALQGDTLETEFLKLEAGDGGGAGVEDQLLALKAEMGLIAPSEESAPKQLSDGEEDETVEAGGEGDGVVDAQVEEVSDEEANNIPEAELLSEFDKLEGKPADA
jgi:phage shock protein A